jgi:ketol-acid reductoisomerase
LAREINSSEIDRELLRGKQIAVIGFGSQGRAQALNLKDFGLSVVVGLRAGSPSGLKTVESGFRAMGIGEAVSDSEVVMMLFPDHVHGETFAREIAPSIQDGAALVFAHGYSIHYREVVPSENIDVVLVAPKGIGPAVRSEFLKGSGVPGLVAVHHDYTGQARNVALSLAHALGFSRSLIYETTFREETEVDLFSEQAVLLGGMGELLRAAFETLTKQGYSPEIAYFECLHELKLIADLLYENGMVNTLEKVSSVARYGNATAGRRLVTDDTRREMAALLEEIRDGSFARKFKRESANGFPLVRAQMEVERVSLLEVVGANLRQAMRLVKH